jgi:predicted metal-dependent phosphoesterase TrpH
VLIDLHCHTSARSGCSSLSPEELVGLAKERGLNAVCFTEHDRSWSDLELAALGSRMDFCLFRGMEVTTELGHALVFGLDRFEPDMYFSARLRDRVVAAGGFMVLAHPARSGQPTIGLMECKTLFDAVEGLNGSDGPAQNAAAASLGAGMALPPIAGSDCHSPREVASAATKLRRPVSTERELVAELRCGRHEIVDLRLPANVIGAEERTDDAS